MTWLIRYFLKFLLNCLVQYNDYSLCLLNKKKKEFSKIKLILNTYKIVHVFRNNNEKKERKNKQY